MEFDHLFAESDIEEADAQARAEQFPNQSSHSSTDNNFTYAPYIQRLGHRHYRPHQRINNCNMCRTRSRRDEVNQPISNNIIRMTDDNSCDYREYRKRILQERKLQKNDTKNKIVNNQNDSLSIAGPSRLVDAPVDYR